MRLLMKWADNISCVNAELLFYQILWCYGWIMNYEDRIVCFIDLLGFKSAVKQSLSEDLVRIRLYETIHDLKPDKVLNETYGDIPFFFLDNAGTVKTAKDVVKNDLREHFGNIFPIVVTQFSDSFVLSCPSNNPGSCILLLKSVYLIHLMYFYNLGMMVRGGITRGKIIHEEGGALFGPAMNEAYRLESTEAKNPKVLLCESAYNQLSDILKAHPALLPIVKDKDDQFSFDLIGIFQRPESTDINQTVEKQLFAIKKDIQDNAPGCLSKIQYLIDRWDGYKSKPNK